MTMMRRRMAKQMAIQIFFCSGKKRKDVKIETREAKKKIQRKQDYNPKHFHIHIKLTMQSAKYVKTNIALNTLQRC